MTKYREILKLHSQGFSQRDIAVGCGCSRNTVTRVLAKAQAAGVAWPLPPEMDDKKLKENLFGARVLTDVRKEPNHEHIHKELAKSGVTLNLLWSEYCEACRLEGSKPLMYTQFCHHYRQFAVASKATMRIQHKPGERMEVDWAGSTMQIIDNVTGKPITVYLFVAVLPYSQYTYAEGFLSQTQESWITAHVNAYVFFRGATRILTPDNLKTGVAGVSDWYSPTINRVYQEMAEYYGTAVIPARVRRPKDKASVESSVGNLSTWIIAALRDWKFFSLHELNEAVRRKLVVLNEKPFQKKSGSRASAFEEEKSFLIPLPDKPFEMATWKVATVQFNYHIAVEKMNYSVPYEYIKRKVDVRLTASMVEVFFQGTRIASHPKRYGYPGQYATVDEHMPPKHRQYGKWNGDRFVRWARSIGPSTEAAVRAILESRKVEEQGYKSCIALLTLSDRYPAEALESACERALFYASPPSIRSIRTLLQSGSCRAKDEEEKEAPSSDFGFTRGAAYYGRKSG